MYAGKRKDISSVARKERAPPPTYASREATPLPDDFVPGRFDVICTCGKTAREHTGNRRYHVIIEMNVKKYQETNSKMGKSVIISSIVDLIRKSSPQAGFIKQEHGRWYRVGDIASREKVGQSFRNLLHTKYRSSDMAKKKRRIETTETTLQSDIVERDKVLQQDISGAKTEGIALVTNEKNNREKEECTRDEEEGAQKQEAPSFSDDSIGLASFLRE